MSLKECTTSAEVSTSLHHLQQAMDLIQERLPPAGLLLTEAVLDERTSRLLSAVDSLQTDVGSSAAAQKQLADSWEKAKMGENFEKLGKNVTLLGVKLDKGRGNGGTAEAAVAAAAVVKREAETTTAAAAAGDARLQLALTELGKDLRSQLDDVHDMVANADETAARTLAEIRADMKVPYLCLFTNFYLVVSRGPEPEPRLCSGSGVAKN